MALGDSTIRSTKKLLLACLPGKLSPNCPFNVFPITVILQQKISLTRVSSLIAKLASDIMNQTDKPEWRNREKKGLKFSSLV